MPREREPRSMYRVQPGLRVFTVDGDELGEVKEVQGEAFKVDAPWKPDYWLRTDDVLSVIPEERVTVDIDSDSLDRYKLDSSPDDRGGRRVSSGYDRFGGSRPMRPRYEGDYRQQRPGGYDWNERPGRRELGREGDIPETEWGRPDFDEEQLYGEPGRRPPQAPGLQGPFRGRGPRGYTRSDEDICAEVCEALTRNGMVDATDVEVTVDDGEVTLSGTVDTRYQKRVADDIAASVRGVHDVHNRLRVITTMATDDHS
jgi:hypothetical protein